MSNNGKEGERLFKEIMEQRGYTVADVSNDSRYWYRDIDFIVTSPTTGAVKTFEVKWDSRINATGNLYLELTSTHSRGGKGWFNFCEADYLVYGDAVARQFYVIPLLELRERVAAQNWRQASCGYDSTGLLVPLDRIQDICMEL